MVRPPAVSTIIWSASVMMPGNALLPWHITLNIDHLASPREILQYLGSFNNTIIN
jgi:hypothetical protein